MKLHPINTEIKQTSKNKKPKKSYARHLYKHKPDSLDTEIMLSIDKETNKLIREICDNRGVSTFIRVQINYLAGTIKKSEEKILNNPKYYQEESIPVKINIRMNSKIKESLINNAKKYGRDHRDLIRAFLKVITRNSES